MCVKRLKLTHSYPCPQYISPESNIYKGVYDLLGFKRVEGTSPSPAEAVGGDDDGREEENECLLIKVLRENFFRQGGGGGGGGLDDVSGADEGDDRGDGMAPKKGGRGDVFGRYMADFEELERLPKISEMVARGEDFEAEGEGERSSIRPFAPSSCSTLQLTHNLLTPPTTFPS